MIGKKYSKLTFDIISGFASEIHRLLLDGELDFGFVDDSPRDRKLHYQAAAQEDLLLCASRDYISNHKKVAYKQSYFEELEYVEYKGAEQILRQWMAHHLKRKSLSLNVRAKVKAVQEVANFIVSGLGVGVLPHHVVEKLKKEGVDLYVFDGKAAPLHNKIWSICLKDHPLTRAAEVTLKELMA